MYRLYFIIMISMFSLLSKAQMQEIKSERIASLQVVAGQDWLEDPDYADSEKWCETEIMKAGHVKEEYQRVIAHFDQVLAEHGYVRDGKLYREIGRAHV